MFGAGQEPIRSDLSRCGRVCLAFLWLSDSTTLSLFYKILGDAVAC